MADRSYLGREIFVFQINVGTEVQEVVSILDADTAFAHGLRIEAILGMVRPDTTGHDRVTPERFQENPAFVEYLHALISDRVYDVEDLRRAAQRQGEGYVYLIDARTPQPDGQVPPADIIGAVKVQDGKLVAASYQRNPHHQLLTQHGFFRLPTELENILRIDLHARGTRPG